MLNRFSVLILLGCLAGPLPAVAQLTIALDAIDTPGTHTVDVRLTNVESHPFNAFKFTVQSNQAGLRVVGLDVPGTIGQGMTFAPNVQHLPLVQGGNSPSRPINADGTLVRLVVSVSAEVRGGELSLIDIELRHGAAAVPFSPATPTLVVAVGSNSPPVAVDDSFELVVGATVSGNVLTNDSDADGDALTTSVETSPQHGSVILLADGNFSYEHTGADPGTDSFVYRVSDGFGGTTTATVNLAIASAPSGVGKSNQEELPELFGLRGNFPNPFSDATRVSFDLATSAEVQVIVLDASGRTRLSTPARWYEPGEGKEVVLRTADLAAGSYLYQLVARSEGATYQKAGVMSLLR